MTEIHNTYSAITRQIREEAALCLENGRIDPELYARYQVNRGLRDINGKGVLTGLTEISDIVSSVEKDGKSVPCEGELYYRGLNIRQLVDGFMSEDRFGFEEITYLLLFGKLPTAAELQAFTQQLSEYRTLPTNFVRDVIQKAPSPDMMNTLARSVLTLFSYDDNPFDLSVENALRQCIQMIALFPMLAVYGYQAHNHYNNGASLYIHHPLPELSTAENILRMLRPDGQYTHLEAQMLDLALVLHAEHGGGNNSTFTMHVVTSSGTDTYSAMAAALCSLKGPKHGGANIMVVRMFEDMKKNVKDWTSEEEVGEYLKALLEKRAFDRSGLIYGMGHAVYSLSDPRALILHDSVRKLAEEKGRQEDAALYALVERLAPQIIAQQRRIYKGVSANIDFYSGFVYSMLDLPIELYTPIFAASRVSGWSAHRIEEIINAGKIIRPSYKNVGERQAYVKLEKR